MKITIILGRVVGPASLKIYDVSHSFRDLVHSEREWRRRVVEGRKGEEKSGSYRCFVVNAAF